MLESLWNKFDNSSFLGPSLIYPPPSPFLTSSIHLAFVCSFSHSKIFIAFPLGGDNESLVVIANSPRGPRVSSQRVRTVNQHSACLSVTEPEGVGVA